MGVHDGFSMKAQIPNEFNCIPYQPNDIYSLFMDAPFPWWISGGWALDLFLQEQTRKHFDIDVSIARRDQLAAQVFLSSWDFWSVKRDESGEIVLSQWGRNEMLGNEYPGVWGREDAETPWRFEFFFQDVDNDIWQFRYCDAIQHPLSGIGYITPDGIPYLRPEIALLTKAARLREVDINDFLRVLPALNSEQKTKLIDDIYKMDAQHPWLEILVR